MIPVDWQEYQLADCINGNPEYGANTPALDFNPRLARYIRITDITDTGQLDDAKRASVEIIGNERYLLQEGDFLFARTGATVGKTFLYHEDIGQAIYAGYLIRFRPDGQILLPEYLEQYTQTAQYWAWVKGTLRAGAQPNINAQEFASLLIPVPSIQEQRSIISVLARWDHAIELTGQLIKASLERKRGLMQQLLTGNRTLAYSRGWSWREIGELFGSVTRFEPWDDDKTYIQAIVKRWSQGIEVRPPLLGRDIKTKNLQVVRAGDFLISDIQASYGAMGMVGDQQDGLYVSNVYTILVPRSERHVYTPYFDQLSRMPLMRHLVAQSSNGFKAERIRLIFVRDAFLRQRVYLPDDVNEQRRIADVLELCDEEQTLLNQKLALFKQQKQGLMQKLLTGKVRVAA